MPGARRGIAADFLSATRSKDERRHVLAGLSQHPPAMQVLFVTPELLSASNSFLALLRDGLYASGSLLLLAVDEAHCISRWGGAEGEVVTSQVGGCMSPLPGAPPVPPPSTPPRPSPSQLGPRLPLGVPPAGRAAP